MKAILRVIDFFIPWDIFTAVFVVFALENVAATYLSFLEGPHWLFVAALALAVANVATADDEEIEELQEDLEDVV